MNGTVTVRPLPIGTSVSGKVLYLPCIRKFIFVSVFSVSFVHSSLVSLQVEKQCAHFFGVTISDEQAEAGIVIRVTSAAQSKFKVN